MTWSDQPCRTIIWQHLKDDQRPQLKVRRRVLALEELQSDPKTEQLKRGISASFFLGLERLMMVDVGGQGDNPQGPDTTDMEPTGIGCGHAYHLLGTPWCLPTSQPQLPNLAPKTSSAVFRPGATEQGPVGRAYRTSSQAL